MQLKPLVHGLLMIGMGAHLGVAQAQAPTANDRLEKVIVTGSSIKRLKDEGALPVQTFNRADIERAGVSSAEQLIALLTSNGNGVDNMASQSDVVAGDNRGNNGASFANLRGQGSRNTLVLLNGRRVASHGLNGTAVNLNTIPMSAIDRVEVLKDGASAIYGTDAIGGVINFITKNDLSGVQLETFVDLPEKKGGEVYGVKASGGIGNLSRDGYNLMFAVAHTENRILTGRQREFVNTFQPDRGLHVDTRGTPIATVFAVATNNAAVTHIFTPIPALGAAGPSSTGALRPGDPVRYNGINPLDLPGGAGCQTMPNSQAYDDKLWNNPATAFGCAWDTGVSATLQQPVENTSAVLRGSLNLGNHRLVGEFVGAQVDSRKEFSEVQLLPNNTVNRYRITTASAAYTPTFNALVGTFPSLEANRGRDIYFRWRCLPCGPREIRTETESQRFFLGLDGPLFGEWDYRTGVSVASSDDRSVIGKGYYYRDGMINALVSGGLNPFSLTQTAAGLASLESAAARNLPLYGGKFELKQADFSASGPVMQLPGGMAMAAVGVDVRRETYRFRGLSPTSAPGGIIIGAPFDDTNSVDGKSRDVKAVYGELALPVLKGLEATLAVRSDQYTGFGRSTNPKVALRYVPMPELLFRGSYSTAFRVPTFNQALNGATVSPSLGVSTLVDPAKCPSLVVSGTDPNCVSISPEVITGGNAALKPETGKIGSLGLVVAPTADLRASIDWWTIELEDSIRMPAQSELARYYEVFKSRWLRDASGAVVAIDQRWVNTGGSKTSGIEWEVQGQFRVGDGRWKATVNGTYLLGKKSRPIDVLPFGPSELGQFNRYGDPGIRWKHSATLTYTEGVWTTSFGQRYSSGYKDAVLPGVAAGRVQPANWNPKVSPYTVYDMSVSYKGFKNLELVAGVKNLLDDDPPFSVYYDSDLGSGSSWDPRVADPRGRAFTLRVKYAF